MAIPTTYTGQNSGAAPVMQPRRPSTAIRETVTNLQQQKRQDQAVERQQEKDFLSSIQSDPISIANKKVMGVQREMIEEYQNQYSNLYRERQGKLTTSDKVEMQSAKQAITAYQAQVQGDYDRYLQDVQRYTSNPSQYSSTHMQEMSQKYLESEDGRYTESVLAPAPTEYSSFLKKVSLMAQGGTNVKTGGYFEFDRFEPDPSGKGKSIYKSTWDKGAARSVLYNEISNNPNDMRMAMEMFSDAPPVVRERIMDRVEEQNSNIGDELQKLNPVLEYVLEQPGVMDRFTDNRVFETSQPISTTRDAQPAPAKSTTFTQGLSPQDTGYGFRAVDDGIRLLYKSTLPNTRGIEIETSKLGDLPKNAIINGDVVLARPRKINKDGTVEINVMTGSWKPVADQDNARELMEYGEGDANWKEEKGVIMDASKASGFTHTVTTTWDNVKGILSSYFASEGVSVEDAWDFGVSDKGWGRAEEGATEDEDYSQYIINQ